MRGRFEAAMSTHDRSVDPKNPLARDLICQSGTWITVAGKIYGRCHTRPTAIAAFKGKIACSHDRGRIEPYRVFAVLPKFLVRQTRRLTLQSKFHIISRPRLGSIDCVDITYPPGRKSMPSGPNVVSGTSVIITIMFNRS
jgi:hypothetical protein